MDDERRVAQALSLLEQLEGWHNFENGLIDPSDWDRFTAFDLIQVAIGRTTLYDVVWGTSSAPANPEEEEKQDR